MNRLITKLRYALSLQKVDYLILCAIGLYIFFSWFDLGFPNGNFLYFGGDASYPLNPQWNIYHMLPYAWMDENAGLANFRGVYFLWTSFFYSLSTVGLSLSIIQKLFLYFNSILPGLSMYYLASVVYTNLKTSGNGKRLCCWIAALFFMFNPVIQRFHQLYFFYGMFPLILALFILFLKADSLKDKIKFCLLTFPLFLGYFMYLPAHNVLGVLLLTLFLYSVGYMLYNRQNIQQVLGSIILYASLQALLTLWILFPLFYVVTNFGARVISETPVLFGTQWAELAQYGGAVVRVFATNFQLETGTAFYFSPGISIWIVNLFFAAMAFSALLIKSKSKMVIYFSLIAIIGIFINVGPNPPWGWIYQWALNNFTILRGFRTVGHTMTMITLAYSVLIGIAISEIYLKIRSYFYKTGKKMLMHITSNILVFATIVLILINGWPLVTGAYFHTSSAYPNNVLHEVPQPYYMVNNWLNDHDASQNYRVLTLPSSISGGTNWIWPNGYFAGTNIVPLIISRPIIHSPMGREGFISPAVSLIYDALDENDFGKMAKLAGLLNVKYILVDGYVFSLKNLGQFQTMVEQSDQTPVQVHNGTKLFDVTTYYLSNTDFETWNAGKLSDWADSLEHGFQETNIVHSGLSSLKLEANLQVSQGLSIDSKGTVMSWSYYLSPLNSSLTYFGLSLQIYFEDGTYIGYTTETGRENSTSVKYIELPKVSGKWINITRDIGDDIYNAFGSNKRIARTGIQLLNSGAAPTGYFDDITIYSRLDIDDLGITDVVTYDKVHLNEIDDEYVFPRVYGTSKYILIDGHANQLTEFLELSNFASNKPVLFLSDQLSPSHLHDIQRLELDESTDVNVVFKQVDPTEYMVHVTSSEPFFLVLSTRFDSEWVARIDGKEVDLHLDANGYANAWLVDKTGTFDIILKYKIQDYYNIAMMMSLFTFVGCIIYVNEDCVRKLVTKFPLRMKIERNNVEDHKRKQ